jgi:DNA repair protein RadC
MRHEVQTVSWRFRDCLPSYPELRNRLPVVIRGPEDVHQNLRFLFDGQVRERFIVLWLNSANILQGFEIVSEGTLNASLVHPREVFRGAIVASCAAIIVTHNHPSGNPEPSHEDINVTRQLTHTGKVVGIPVHDHIIFAKDTYLSFAERGLM